MSSTPCNVFHELELYTELRAFMAVYQTSGIIYKKLQTIYLMLYKRQIKNSKNQKYKHERIR